MDLRYLYIVNLGRICDPRQDPLLSFEAAEALQRSMRDAGLSTDWVPFRGGHELSMPVISGLGQFLSRVGAE